jgi:hypothetical protein
MATLAVQELPANGGELTLAWTAATAADEFPNDGSTILVVRTTAAAGGNPVIKGVPAADSGRDVDVTVTLVGTSDFQLAGPFKPRNFNAGGVVQITAAAPANTDYAVLRVTTG